jgi:hypothetical protein
LTQKRPRKKYERVHKVLPEHSKLPKDMTNEELWTNYGDWMKMVCRDVFYAFPSRFEGPEELYASAWEALYQAAQLWKSDGGTTFANYSKRYMTWKLERQARYAPMGKSYQVGGKIHWPRLSSIQGMEGELEEEGSPRVAAAYIRFNEAAKLLQRRMSLEYATDPETLASLGEILERVRLGISLMATHPKVREFLLNSILDELQVSDTDLPEDFPVSKTAANMRLRELKVRLIKEQQAA